jgi:hypothetical protein
VSCTLFHRLSTPSTVLSAQQREGAMGGRDNPILATECERSPPPPRPLALLALTGGDHSTEPVDIFVDKFRSGEAEQAQFLRSDRVA